MSGDDDPKKNDDDDDDEEEEQRAVKGRKEDAEPKKRYGPKRSEPPAAAPVRRQRDSTGDPGKQNARKPKGKAACKNETRVALVELLTASANITKSYLSID